MVQVVPVRRVVVQVVPVRRVVVQVVPVRRVVVQVVPVRLRASCPNHLPDETMADRVFASQFL